MSTILGWDIGGANLKLARIEAGRVVDLVQSPCPALAAPEKFDRVLAEASGRLAGVDRHAVTMTGELSDVFPNRTEGVAYLVGLAQRAAGGTPVQIYAGRAGFLPPEQAVRQVPDVASANWHATACLLAAIKGNGLLADIGTTTTDLVPFAGGAVRARGFTDAERLTEGELIYSGVVRTPVMAMADRAPFAGREQGIAAERFATMADVYRLTGELPGDADPFAAADNRDKSVAASATRLARMLGRDGDDARLEDWVALAQYFAGRQLARLENAAQTLVARELLPPEAPLIGAGCGRFLARRLAARLPRPYLEFTDLIETVPDARDGAAVCAPAVAVGLLAAKIAEAG
jgi:(4-(4-[2-(gamma-L-glutamylamino)ethyl]phenoxymethyl)furan-2-yl)methanamine synthase